jgi:prolyl oligopeptidase
MSKPVLALLTLMSLAPWAAAQPMKYPDTRRGDQVDEYHGRAVADPYRWLEDDARTSPEVADWIAAENQVTRAFLDAIPERGPIRAKLAELWNYERYSAPWRMGGRYFYFKNDGLQNQSVLYWADRYDADGQVLIDPNAWAADGTIALGQAEVSDDGRLLAYARQEAGSDWVTIHVMEIESGRQLDDVIEWSRHGNIVWNAAGDGFFYARYPEPPAGEKYQAKSLDQMIYYHKLGEPQSADQLVYSDPEHPEWGFWLGRTDDDRYLVLSISRSTDPQNKVYVRPVDAPLDGAWTKLIDDFDNEFAFIGNEGSRLLFMTDLAAPTKRIVAIEADSPGRSGAVEVVPADDATLETASLLAGKLICQYIADVASRVDVFSAQGERLSQVALPGVGSAGGFGGKQTDAETFYTFTSYTTPPSVFRYDVLSGESQLIRAPQIKFDPSQYESRLDFATSKDGTRVPVIVTSKKGLPRDGQNPTVLYGYGGFNIPLTPAFSVEYAVWMDLGGVVAVANLRGGGEYGEAWHQAGKKHKKQNVFDDFIAAAEWLIAEKYASPPRLAIYGGSNGGLLVGAAMTQRPELFGAAMPAVGVLDMLRFHQFTAGHFWVDEYGSADDPEEFKTLLAYSPYHNVKDGAHYPATLITTADTDDRVVPMHSFKFGAALQHAQGGDAPILLRIETRAGHGAGTPITKRIDQAADRWAFLWKALGMSSPGDVAPGR